MPGRKVMQTLRKIPIPFLILLCLTLGLAPFAPEPHVWEKLKMLASGELVRPVDMFDMLLHGAPWLLLVARLMVRQAADGED